jgi:hypothetical protein
VFYPLAIVGVVAAAMPCGPLWFASVPVAVMAVVALRQAGIRESFASASDSLAAYEPLKESALAWMTRDRVRMPALALIVLGVLNVGLPLAINFFALVANGYRGDDFLPLFFSVPSGVVMIAGGVAMLKMRWYGLAVTGAIAAMFPCGPVWIVSLPVGIWSLVVLRRDDVIDAFAVAHSLRPRPEPPRVDVAAIRQQINGPAKTLLAAALVGLVLVGVIGWLAAAFVPHQVFQPEAFLMFCAGPVAISLPFTGLMVLGAWKMRKLEVYGMALTASFVAVLPIHLTVLLTLPVGVWALILLARRDVRAAFDRVASPEAFSDEAHFVSRPAKPGQPDAEVRSKLKVSSIGLILAGIYNGLVALGLAVAIAVNAHPDVDDPIPVALLLSGLGMGFVFVFVGARMLRFRSYYLALAAAVLAVLPTSPAWPISLAFGINALVRLASQEMRREFETERQQHLPANLSI